MKAWYLGNTTIRNPYRLKEGLRVLVDSSLHGNLDGWENESQFAHLLHAARIVNVKRIQENASADASDVGRKWRAALMQLGFITPKLSRNLDAQGIDPRLRELVGAFPHLTGRPYEVTPNGKRLLEVEGEAAEYKSVAAEQECFLRSLAAYQIPSAIERQVPDPVFSPLRLVLEVLVELERAGLDGLLRFEEIAWIVQLARNHNEIGAIVQQIQAYREQRQQAQDKSAYDRAFQQSLAGALEGQSLETLDDYADSNIRYLKATGLFSAKGRGIMLAANQRALIDQLLSQPFNSIAQNDALYLPTLWNGAILPTDHEPEAIASIRVLVVLLEQRGETTTLPDNLLSLAIQDLTQIRLRLVERWNQLREQEFAEQQRTGWQEILPYLRALTKNTPSKYADIPSAEAPAYLEWTIWRAFLAINSLVKPPWGARHFKVDQDFLPIGTAPSGRPDMIFEFPEYVLVVEVTLSSSSRQEAMEGEPVRRHVASIVEQYAASNKEVYGLFIANTIDSNTAETFRIGVWYRPDDSRLALRIVPLTLDQFLRLFEAGFSKRGALDPAFLEQVLRYCRSESNRDAPEWKQRIEAELVRAIQRL